MHTILVSNVPAIAQKTANPYSIKEEAWLNKKQIPVNQYQWGTNKEIELGIFKILRHKKRSKNFLFAAIGMGVFAAFYKETHLEGFTVEVLVAPLVITSGVHFILARTKAKKLRRKFITAQVSN